jgi:phosphate uptake regulator
MLSSSLECLANRDAAGARALHLVSRESSSLNSQLIQQVNHGLASGRLQPQVGTALVLAGNALEQISQYALDVANLVRRLYAGEEPPGGPQEAAQ